MTRRAATGMKTGRIRLVRLRIWLAPAVILLASAALLLWWWVERRSLSAEERALVGTWVMRKPTPDLSVEYEFRADRTCRVVNRDPRTGQVIVAGDLADHWRLSDGVLRLSCRRDPGSPVPSLLSGNTQRRCNDVLKISRVESDRYEWYHVSTDRPDAISSAGVGQGTGASEGTMVRVRAN